jgi:ABC-type phosphate transport system substrate-binding protein
MKKSSLLFAVLAIMLVRMTPLWAADVKVIANSSVSASSISADDVKRVFLGTKSSLEDGSHVEPVFGKSGHAHEEFLKDYLGKTDAAVATYYRSLVFTGKGAFPKSFASDSEIVSYVSKTKGAIGYVAADTTAAGVKTLSVK